MDALNANGKTQLFTNLVWRPNAHTAVRKTSSETEKEKNKKKKERKKKRKKKTQQNKQQQQQEETNKQKMGNWSRPGQTVWRAIDVHCWQGFSAVLRPVKTAGCAPFRFKCSSSSFSSFVICRISARRNLNCQNSSKSLNLCKGFVLSWKIRFLRSSRLWR